jgi:predicted nucleotidyltransferase
MRTTLPETHRLFLAQSVERLRGDSRIVGVAAGGSFVLGTMDEFSDLDLVVVVTPAHWTEVMADRLTIAAKLGRFLAGFTGEHVGEPRLLICLYGPPLLHVDFKFVSLADFSERVEDPVVLWEKDHELSRQIKPGTAVFPGPNKVWIEDRFWIWVHYATAKIGRGEYFEALDFLGSLRGMVLGPLILERQGRRPQGVRRIEEYGGDYLPMLLQTIATHDRTSCLAALRAAIHLYRLLRECSTESAVETAVMKLLAETEVATEGVRSQQSPTETEERH